MKLTTNRLQIIANELAVYDFVIITATDPSYNNELMYGYMTDDDSAAVTKGWIDVSDIPTNELSEFVSATLEQRANR